MPETVVQGHDFRPSRRRRWVLVACAAVALALLIIFPIAVLALVPLTSESARVRLIAALSERLEATVELQDLRLRAFPRLQAEGSGLTIRHHGRRDVPPLISIAHFSAEGTLLALARGHVARVTLSGLDIEIPPDRNRDAADSKAEETRPAPAAEPAQPSVPDAQRPRDWRRDFMRSVTIDELTSTGAQLVIIPKDAGDPSKVWSIHDLRMSSVAADRAMPFEATLTNAVPPGDIVTRGSFGPWQKGDPGLTPLGGMFTFDDADLSVFKGIAGILSAHGSFGGELQRIDVHGETETPQFQVKTGQPVPLRARYHAIVDGTNGNTILERIDASFLGTAILARGSVAGTRESKGRTVKLDVAINRGRLEDILKLAIKTPAPPMVGQLQLSTTFVLPPGETDVVNRLRLKGRFSIQGTRFTNLDVQGKINELSQRSSVKDSRPETPPQVTSRFNGTFALKDGSLAIPDVSFDVPGATVQLAGQYKLVPETIDFKGTLYMDAKVSQTTTGFKSLLLKIVDPLFSRKGGGSAVPIKISGERSNPSFGLDRSRLFHRDRD
jgi:hypothetical protein